MKLDSAQTPASTLDPRRRATELVIGAGLCLGAYLGLVDPAEKQLAAVRAQVAELQQQVSGEGTGSTNALREALAATQQRGSAARARSLAAADEARLLATITTLAENHGVRLEQLAPLNIPAIVQRPTDAGTTPPPLMVARSGYNLSATGTFPAIAAFTASLQRDAGLCSVRALTIAPDLTPGSASVMATIETEHAVLLLPAIATVPTQAGATQP